MCGQDPVGLGHLRPARSLPAHRLHLWRLPRQQHLPRPGQQRLVQPLQKEHTSHCISHNNICVLHHSQASQPTTLSSDHMQPLYCVYPSPSTRTLLLSLLEQFIGSMLSLLEHLIGQALCLSAQLVGSPLLAQRQRHIKGCLTAAVASCQAGAGLAERLNARGVASTCRIVKQRAFIKGGCVHVSACLKQQPDAGLAANICRLLQRREVTHTLRLQHRVVKRSPAGLCCPVQGRAAIARSCLGISACLQQQPDAWLAAGRCCRCNAVKP